eukprot:Seg3952.3 transcript_id=Seg3952.3/GoldUCD/mRNA.D3Y31 product=Obscurin protein_id=Seg3952.3/GoldUCD/D3Y31
MSPRMLLKFLFLLVALAAICEARRQRTGRLRMKIAWQVSREFSYGQDALIICQHRYWKPEQKGVTVFFNGSNSGNLTKIEGDDIKYDMKVRHRGRRYTRVFLIIQNLQAVDQGTYTCKAGGLERSVEMRLPGKEPKEPLSKFVSNGYHAAYGGEVSLYCACRMEPCQAFRRDSWTRLGNGERIGNEKDQLIIRKWVVKDIDRSNSGKYFCKSGNYMAVTEMMVHGTKKAGKRMKFERRNYVKSYDYFVNMVCRGNRKQDLKLFKAEGSKLSELKNDQNKSEEVHKGSGYIWWGKNRVKPEDAGYYICKSESGREAAVTTLSVYGRLKLRASSEGVRFKIGKDGKIGINIGEDREKFAGKAALVRWIYPGKLWGGSGGASRIIGTKYGSMSATTESKYEILEDGSLIVKNVTSADAGVYKVQHFGDGYGSLMLEIKVDP